MKALIFSGVFFLTATQAIAQSGSTYDWQTGNSYNWNQNYDGSTTVYGNNFGNGTMWNQTIQPNGNQHGIDANGNFWNYNSSSKTYFNSNGTTCIGEGASKVCF